MRPRQSARLLPQGASVAVRGAAVLSSGPRQPGQRPPAVPLAFDQFRYAFADVVPEAEAHELNSAYCLPGVGKPIFQAGSANINPWTEAKVDTENVAIPGRGHCLTIDAGWREVADTALAFAHRSL